MNPPTTPEEPFKNVELESAILGLRMTLTPEETAEARIKFLDLLRISPLAIPTAEPVATGPDGAVLPNAPINLLIVNTAEGVSGVPAFTTLSGLRTALPQVENGMYLTGADLGNILGQSEHKLFVTSPDMNVEVETHELEQLALAMQQQIALEQQAVQHNEPLETALAVSSTGHVDQEAIVAAFMEGFCRYPVLAEADGDAEALVLSQDTPQNGQPVQELALLTIEGALPAFSSEAALRAWDSAGRNAIVLKGEQVVQLATQADVETILLDTGSPHTQTLHVRQGQVSLR